MLNNIILGALLGFIIGWCLGKKGMGYMALIMFIFFCAKEFRI